MIFNTSHQVASDDLSDESIFLHSAYVLGGALIAPVIVFTNFMLIAAILLYPGGLMNTTIYIMSLAIAGLILGGINLPVAVLIHEFVMEYRYLCIVWITSINAVLCGINYTMLMLSVDRYIAVMSPLVYRNFMTLENTGAAVNLIWLGVVMLSTLPIMRWSTLLLYQRDKHCYHYFILAPNFVYWTTVVTMPMCLGLALVLYVLTFVRLARDDRRQAQCRRTSMYSADASALFLRRVSSVKMAFSFTVVYIVFWLPYFVGYRLVYNALVPLSTAKIIEHITMFVGFISCLVNAPVFVFWDKVYSEALMCMVRSFPWQWKARLLVLHRNVNARHSIFIPDEFQAAQTSMEELCYANICIKDFPKYIQSPQ